MYQKPKGTRDILPEISYKWQYMEEMAKQEAKKCGYQEVRTPTFESTDLFLRSVGESSDIVNKEMYTFKDKGDRSLTLRPEGTAGVVRAFVENGLVNDTMPQKMFYIVNNFRYENPQAGRFREHTQFGCESFGINTPFGELETITLAKTILDKVGVKNLSLHINSIGCQKCKPIFNRALSDFAEQNKTSFCEDCNRRMTQNPMRMLDCKNENCQQILKNAPKLKDYLCDECKEHFMKVLELLRQNGIEYVVDTSLVRGLDYYTKTVFEFISDNIDGKGKSLTVCAGGRYDGLVEEIGGKPTCCVGFGMGLDRLILLLSDVEKPQTDVYVLNVGGVSADKTFEIAKTIREQGYTAQSDLLDRSFKAQFKYAEKIDARYVLIVGDEELKTGVFNLKNQQSNTEEKLKLDEIIELLKRGE